MKFTSIMKQLVMEQAKMEVLVDKYTKPFERSGKKYKPLMSMTEFLRLIQGDPTTQMNNVNPDTAPKEDLNKIKPGKYSEWILRNYLKPETERNPGDNGYERELQSAKETFIEDLYKINDDLKKFVRFKNRIPADQERDVNKLTPSQLYELVKDFSLEKTKGTKQEKEEAKSTYNYPGSEVLFKGKDWTVVKIEDQGQKGKDAACFFGGYSLDTGKGETRWCTSAPGLNWFERYIKDGPLYVILPNDSKGKTGQKTGLPATRYQFHFQSNQYMDPSDRGINLVEYLNGPMKELKPIFKPEFAKGLTVGGDKLVVDSFTHGAVGKFIGLYGIEDLIDSLPETLKDLQIQNKDSNMEIDIKIPESISRFKDLQMILLENCISAIPDSICQLKKLKFIALTQNKNLRTIPECIATLPNLTFLNLKKCPNVKIPDAIKKMGNDMHGEGIWDFFSGDE